MPFSHGFAVVLGTLDDFQAEGPIDFGRYRHGMLWVGTPEGTYRCAVDVDTRLDSEPLRWRIQPLRVGEWSNLLALPDGRHQLVPAETVAVPGNGGTDYIRDVRLCDLIYLPDIPTPVPPTYPFPPEERLVELLPHRRALDAASVAGFSVGERRALREFAGADRAARIVRRPAGRPQILMSTPMRFGGSAGHMITVRPPWNVGTSGAALLDLEAMLQGAVRVIVMGENFNDESHEKGLHNVHQNQGDAIGSGFARENGIWHDGITIAVRADGTAAAFMNRFENQSDHTDDMGRPI